MKDLYYLRFKDIIYTIRQETPQILSQSNVTYRNGSKIMEIFGFIIKQNNRDNTLSKDEAKKLNAKLVIDKNQPVNISFLISLINSAKYIVSNDTGPAHICSHLNKKGIALFGSHNTAKKVNIGNTNFKTLTVNNLAELKAEDVLSYIKINLD